jgi:recombination protein RecR
MSPEEAEHFAKVLVNTKKSVHYCKECGNYTDLPVCEICSERDKSLICVVKEPKDVLAFEKCKEFRGVYHVLHGTLNPMEGIGPNDIRIKELLSRLDGVKEIIIATNPDVEGDATAVYIARLLKPMGIKVTRIARGIPSGSEIEFADEVTLSRAMQDRTVL